MKTIPVLDEADLRDGEMKQVAFGEGKILLARIGNQVRATSAFCTHYGAPLAKGVLTSDGKVICPWHGACFDMCTGDIEDAPAMNPLHSFKARVADGKVYVTASPARTLKDSVASFPKIPASFAENSGKGIVIVGGGSGALHTVQSLREHGYKGQITVLTQESHMPIDRTKLSKTLNAELAMLELRSAADLKIKFGTTIRTGVAVTFVDIANKNVRLGLSQEMVPYDTLVLAPGATPRRLPVDGATLENVFTLRGVEDTKKIDAAAQEGKHMVVIGSSFISMELVGTVALRKLASIHVIGMEEYPFERILGKEIGKGFKRYFEETHNVQFHMQSRVDKIVPSEANPALAAGVVVNGQSIQADFVIMGVGVGPATDFLKGSGIQLERDGGVRVDKYLKVKGAEDVYAIGDIAHYPDTRCGVDVRIEHWNVAANQGRAVGKTIAGRPQEFVNIPVFWSARGLRYCGYGASFSEVIIKGDPQELKFVAYYVRDGAVVAVSSMQNDPIVAKATELLRLGLMPSPAELRAGKDLLTTGSPASGV